MMSTAEVYNEDMRRKALKASGDDLIRRRDVINAIFNAPIANFFDDVTAKKSDLVSAVIQIQPDRKKGKWIWDDEGYHCSECWFHAHGNTLECMDGTYRFCPSCGAEMEGE